MNKVGEHDVSPYLTQRLRSIEEVQAERERRQRELPQLTQTSSQTPPQPPAPAPADKPDTSPGRVVDERA